MIAGVFFGQDGFWGTRASLMMDVVVTAMAVIVPLMAWSIWRVRNRALYQQHKRLQLALGAVLLLTVTLFELELRLVGWRDRAADSPLWQAGALNDAIDVALAAHLAFAIPTPLLWIAVIAMALRKFPNPPRPSGHSRRHRFWGTLAAGGMIGTSVTGWVFYYLAFAT